MGYMGTDERELLNTILPRHELIECLEEEPRTKPELTRECEVSRSTINRGINSLLDAGAVERIEGSRYELTLYGSILHRDLDRLLDRFETLREVEALLTEVGKATNLQAELFDDATIRPPEGMGITAAIDAFKGANRLRIIDPPFGVVYMLVAAKPDLLGDIDTTILVRDEMVAEIASIETLLDESGPQSDVELRRTEDELPFSVAIAQHGSQTVLYLVLQNRQGGIAVVRTEAERAVRWGEDLYDRLSTGSVPFRQLQTTT